MTTRAVLYARVSSDDRAKTGGENLADQLRLCREHAEQRGYQVEGELAEDDRGASGASFDLPQLSRALEMARAGQFDVLIVRELDRLSRDLAKQLIVEQELKRAGVAIEYVLYDFPDTPEGRLNKNLRAMLAEYEREKIKQRMTRGKLRKIRDGEAINHGHPPFGYQNVEVGGKATLAINEDEAATVRLIFRWYTEGDGEQGPMSMRALARKLSDLRIPTYNDLRKMQDCTKKTLKGRGQWERSAVGSILSNETYTGTWYYGRRSWDEDDWIAVDVPVIIDAATWEAAQERRSANKRDAKRNRKHDYLLAGRLRCGSCGRMMVGSPNYSYYKGQRTGMQLYYRCQAHARDYACEYRGISFRAEWADAIAWRWVRELLTKPKGLESSLRDYQAQREKLNQPLRERLDVIEGLLSETRAKLRRLMDLYINGEFDREDLTARKSSLENERDTLQERRAHIEGRLQDQLFSEERLQSILAFAETIGAGIEDADADCDKRREIVEALEVTGELYIKDGEKWMRLFGALGETASIVSSSTASIATAVASATRSTISMRRCSSRPMPSTSCATSYRASESKGLSAWAR